MSRYNEMCEAAAAGRKAFHEREKRCEQYMVTLVQGFVKYCEIPSQQIRLLRWNEDKQQYTEPEQGGSYLLPNVIVSEDNGKPIVKVGRNGKTRQIDFNVPQQCNEFYENIVEMLKQVASEGPKSTSNVIGFAVSS